MKKIKLPLEMANGVMVRTIDELKENWDLKKVVEHFVSGKLVTWLNDRYYSDIAEKIENLPKDDGKKLQQALCKVFDMPCEDVELDVDEIAERKRRKDLLRQYTSEEKILDNVDHVAFDQEEMADLLDEGVAEIYLCNNKFIIPLNVSGKKYVGVGDNVIAEIRSKEAVDFKKLDIEFENVKFDDKYQAIHVVISDKKVGDVIVLGEWHNEPIEWQVLDVKDGKALLLSKYIIDVQSFGNNHDFRLTWETCKLRAWLNNNFYCDAFSDREKELLILSNVISDIEYSDSDIREVTTRDKVFLLSMSEVMKYFNARTYDHTSYYEETGQTIRVIETTIEATWCWKDYARNALSKKIYCWWLRSVTYTSGRLVFEGSSFCVSHYEDINGVRPACWVDLSKLEK